MADEQAALLAQIRALSGAIDHRKSSRGRGRGRGRGASLSVGPSRHRTLVLSGGGAANPGDGKAEQNGSTPSDSTQEHAAGGDGDRQNNDEGWVKRKSTHNMSLVSKTAFEKTEPARLAAIAATQSSKNSAAKAKQASKGTSTKRKSSSSVRRGDKMGEVIVDGVVFEFDETGTKLVKKDPQPSEDTGSSSTQVALPSTPLKTSIDGRKFVRTKTGNLISRELLDQRRESRRNADKLKRLGEMGKDIGSHQRMRYSTGKNKSDKLVRKRGLCTFYNKTGQCKRGLSCPYVHDANKLAICPGILRPGGCVLPAGSCPLSHDRRPERVPHCVHFLRLGSCRNGDDCLYTHPAPGVQLSNDSSICMDFSDLGWCERGASCTERHTWDCPEFLRKGSCSRKGCKLMHVVRGENLKPMQDEHNLADDDLFVRDDGAAEASVGVKRKRDGDEDEGEDEHRGESREGSEDGSDDEGQDEEEQHPTWKAKKTKAFAQQQDFISFGLKEGEEVDDESGDESASGESVEGDGDESVHTDSSDDEE